MKRRLRALLVLVVGVLLMWVALRWLHIEWRGPTWANWVYWIGFVVFIHGLRLDAREEEARKFRGDTP